MHLNKYKKIILLTVLNSLFSGYLLAQEDKSECVINLELAQSKYDQGRIQDVEALIITCIEEKEFDKSERIHALKLLTLTYIFLEEPEKAEANMLKLLETNHEFEVNAAIDPSEFINLYEKYRHNPIFNVGFLFGFAFASPIITHLNSTADLNNDSRQSYAPLLGIRTGLYIEYNLFEKFYILGGPSFQILEFEKTHQLKKIVSDSINGGFEGAEEITSIELPLIAQYHLLEKDKITLYGGLGLAPQFLISESYQGDATTFNIDGSGTVTTNTLDLTEDRLKFNVSALAVAGLKLKISEGFLNLQIRYSHQLLNSSNPSNSLTPTDPNLVWNLNESYDGIRLQDFGFSVGYTVNIYKPKKLR